MSPNKDVNWRYPSISSWLHGPTCKVCTSVDPIVLTKVVKGLSVAIGWRVLHGDPYPPSLSLSLYNYRYYIILYYIISYYTILYYIIIIIFIIIIYIYIWAMPSWEQDFQWPFEKSPRPKKNDGYPSTVVSSKRMVFGTYRQNITEWIMTDFIHSWLHHLQQFCFHLSSLMLTPC
jgi:hypothetical protein